MTPTKKADLVDEMVARYGTVMRGPDLYRALGFRTYSGFYKANKNNQLSVKVFYIEGRRGVFALTGAVARFLESKGSDEST
ncbi:MAG: hypothetical protein HY273_07775 [Gammaproteobacteria bacterium]|nr:hypothetical protein [Gammaproteobacteria bacterium]